MNIRMIGVVIGALGLLSACAQQEEPGRINPQPVYNKFGEGSCESGYIYIPGTVRQPECIPEDECEPQYDTAGNLIDCLPPHRRPDPGGNDDSTSGGGRPSSTPGTPTTGAAGPIT